jgi:AbrB family looped-hinge helix DNA binding protein
METSTLTSKGQLLIPKRLRNKYRIQAGAKVAFIETKDGLLLKAMDEAYFDQFAGLLKDVVPSTAEFKKWKAEEKEKEEHRTEQKFSSPAKRRK